MAGVQSVEGLLDAPLTARIEEQWQALHDAGLASQLRKGGPTNTPHLTFVVVTGDRLEPPVEAALGQVVVAAMTRGLTVRLGGLVVFPHRESVVLARAVVPSAELLELHADLHAACAGVAGVVEHSWPGRWTPHVTLARRMPRTQVNVALSALGRVSDEAGPLAAVRRWDGVARRAWSIP